MYFEHLVVANILRKSVASNLISCVHISFQHQFISNLKLEHVLMSKLFTLLKKIFLSTLTAESSSSDYFRHG